MVSKEHTVSLKGSGRNFTVRAGESVLDAALRQGVMLPYSCRNGTCASCKGLVVEGEICYPKHPPLALDPGEAQAGLALFCQCAPLTDLTIAIREIEAVRDIPVHRMPARVIEKQQLSESVVSLTLRLPRAIRLQFLAGQYVDVLLPGGKRRAFSIASSPHQEGEIELHIRHVEGGDFTGFVFDELQVGGILRLEGPLGTFFVRNDQPSRPLLLVGGGTGFAPLKAMIEYLLEKRSQRPLHLFWGARSEADLYSLPQAQGWAREHPHIEFTPALSEPLDGSAWQGETGFIHEVVLRCYPQLAEADVYMSGPPVMIDAARHAFTERGLPAERLYYDSFEFGTDVPVDVLAEPH